MTSQEQLAKSKEWLDGWRAWQQGDIIGMSIKEMMSKSNEWKDGVQYACHEFIKTL